jgi:hypothetical protein
MSAALAAAFHYTLTGRWPERRAEEPHDGRSA